MKLAILPALGITTALLFGVNVAPASASVIQDPASGTCYADIKLDQSKLALSTTDDQLITGKVSNPNNCDNLFPITVALADRNQTKTEVSTDNLGRFTFNINAGTYNRLGTQLEFGKMKIVALSSGFYSYLDADGYTQNGQVVYTSTPTVEIRYKSRLSISAAHRGSLVKVTLRSTQFDYNYNGWGVNGDTIKVQQRKHGHWVTVKSVKPGKTGVAHVTLKSKKKITLRALTPTDASTWNATSGTITK